MEGLKASNESGEKGMPELRRSAGADPGFGPTDFRSGVRGSGLATCGWMIGADARWARRS